MKEYQCRLCGVSFHRRYKGQNRSRYCSRQCAGTRYGPLTKLSEAIDPKEFSENFLPGYHATKDGKLYRLTDRGWVELRQHPCNGYRIVSIDRKTWRVHRAVAMAYCPNPEGKEQVNHIDCDKANNCADNLEWVTREENMQHAYEMGRLHGKLGAIYGVGRNGEGVFLRSTEEGRKIGFTPQKITAVLNGRARSAKGYVWYRAAELET